MRHYVFMTGAVAIALLVTSCGTIAGITGTASPPEDTPTPAEQPAAAAATQPATRSQSSAARAVTNFGGATAEQVFVGVSPPLRDRSDEEAAAILHVAEQASRARRIVARYRYISQRDGGSVGYLEDIVADWDADYADTLVDSVVVQSVLETPLGTVVHATVPEVDVAPINFDAASATGEGLPTWVNQTPRIDGYLVAVGASQRNRRLRDSVDNADQEALKGLLLQSGTTLRMVEDRRDVERVGTTGQVTSAEEATAALRDFRIIARYVTEDERYYYSLAVAREENR